MSNDKDNRFTNATQAQKSAAFEWLRSEALKVDNPNWFHAGVAMAELARLNAEITNKSVATIPASPKICACETTLIVKGGVCAQCGGTPRAEQGSTS